MQRWSFPGANLVVLDLVVLLRRQPAQAQVRVSTAQAPVTVENRVGSAAA